MSYEFIKNVESLKDSTELEGKDDQTKQYLKSSSQTYEGDVDELLTKDNILLDKPIVFEGIGSNPHVVRSFNGYVDLVLEKIGINEEPKKQMKAELERLSKPLKYQFLNSPELQTIIGRLINTDILFNELYKKHNSKFSPTVKDKWMKLLAQLTKLQVITTIKKVDLIPVISTIIKIANDKMEVMNDLVVKKMGETTGIKDEPEKEFEVPQGLPQSGQPNLQRAPSTPPPNAGSTSAASSAQALVPALQPASAPSTASTASSASSVSASAPSSALAPASAASSASAPAPAPASASASSALQPTAPQMSLDKAKAELAAREANDEATLAEQMALSSTSIDVKAAAIAARQKAAQLRAAADSTQQKYLKLEANKKAYEYYQQKYLKYKSKYLEQ